MKYLHLSIFGGHKKRHGGTRRSEQLTELLKDTRHVSINPYVPLRQLLAIAVSNPIHFLESLAFSFYLLAFKGLSPRGLVQFALYGTNLIKIIKSEDYDIVLHETAPGISIVFMQYLARKGIPYIALPHNIEYLVVGQTFKALRSNSHVYRNEIEGYLAARKVIAICEFDTAILRCSGINAETLPYYPVNSDKHRFAAIRELRKQSRVFDGFLLLGTVENTPTYNGFKEFLETIREACPDIRLTVAGYGTEIFRQFEGPQIRILGAVASPELEQLLVQTRAILINQPQTTGFLTKLVEMNLCGVPQIILSDYYQATNLAQYGIIRIDIQDLRNVEVSESFSAFPEQLASAFQTLIRPQAGNVPDRRNA